MEVPEIFHVMFAETSVSLQVYRGSFKSMEIAEVRVLHVTNGIYNAINGANPFNFLRSIEALFYSSQPAQFRNRLQVIQT